MPKTTAKKAPATPAKKVLVKTVAAVKKTPKVPVVRSKKTMEISAEERMDAPAKKAAAGKEIKPKKTLGTYYYATGMRKTSMASVRLIEKGTGVITINDRTFENYFPVFTDQDKVLSPLRTTNQLKTFDILVKVLGGGIHSQAEAIRHGISKALLAYNAEYRSLLKPIGFLTRDSRVKERKKYGLKRARRAPQWQKR